MAARRYLIGCVVLAAPLLGCCSPSASEKDMTVEERFAHLEKIDVTVAGTTVRAWVAKSHNDVQNGLMFVEADDMQPYTDGAEKGMFFYFERQRSAREGFWMRNVPIPLDIAFLTESGEAVTVETMAPHDERSTFADDSYRFALEVRGGLLKNLRFAEGDAIEIPPSVLNSTP